MKKGSKRFLLILFFFLSTTYVPLNKKTQSTVFTIKNILIENNKVIEKGNFKRIDAYEKI